MVEPRHIHWVAAKHVLRYLHGTVGYGLRYVSGEEVKLQGYLDSNWAGSVVDKKSTLGCCFNLGSMMISWFSRKQTSVAFNLAKAEYMAVSTTNCEATWVHNLLVGLFDQELDPTVIYYNN